LLQHFRRAAVEAVEVEAKDAWWSAVNPGMHPTFVGRAYSNGMNLW
jgi:hypothetical protein